MLRFKTIRVIVKLIRNIRIAFYRVQLKSFAAFTARGRAGPAGGLLTVRLGSRWKTKDRLA
jgi:hypothetical protein